MHMRTDSHDGPPEAAHDETAGCLGVPEWPRLPRVFRGKRPAPARGDEAGAVCTGGGEIAGFAEDPVHAGEPGMCFYS